MRKNTTNTKTQETKTQEHVNIYDFDKIMETHKEETTKNGNALLTFTIDKDIVLTILDCDEFANATLRVCGIAVTLRIINGKNGAFVSYPQYKNNKGEYVPLVTNYNKDMNEIIKKIVSAIYDDSNEVPFN